MNYTKPHITNDILSPCNKNKRTAETIATCCGCPEWLAWKAKREYVGKHLKEDKI